MPQGAEIFYVLLLGVVFTAISGDIYVGLLAHVTAQAVGILAYLEPVGAGARLGARSTSRSAGRCSPGERSSSPRALSSCSASLSRPER